MTRFLRSLGILAICFAALWSVPYATAQEIPGMVSTKPAPSDAVPALPDKLTRDAVRDVLSELSDQQARELLLQELDKRIAAEEAKAAKKDNRPFSQVMQDWTVAMGANLKHAVVSTPNIPDAIRSTWANIQKLRGGASILWLWGGLLVCVLAGLIASRAVSWKTQRLRDAILSQRATNLWTQITILIKRLLFHCIGLIAFLAVGHLTNLIFNQGYEVDQSMVWYFINAIGWTWFAVLVARFVLAPNQPDLRLCAFNDEDARYFTWRIGLCFGWMTFTLGLLIWLQGLGWPLGETRLGFWFNLAFYLLIILTLWQGRHALRQMITSHSKEGSVWRRIAGSWAFIAIGMVVLQWIVVELFVATGNLDKLSLTAMNTTLVLTMSLPLFEPIIRGIVEATWPDDETLEPSLQAAHEKTQDGLVRCGRVILLISLALLIAMMWGVDFHDLAAQGIGAQLAGVLVEVSVILAIAYGFWEIINILADRQMAMEQVALGIDPDAEDQFEGEGGQGGTRLGTLMPLLRGTGKVAIVVVTGLAILGELGVNVTPLLAGAGIIGLAIGFGAQTLVKDVISGVFFLVDDAFRKGEYIDLGNVKGTVEKISIRSMQLRHHNGPLNTVPFGEIRYLTNFSRDWVLMKLPLRVTYDTDVEKMRKLIKKLGQELLEDPELGPKFMQPLKSQGVVQMEDSAMIVRVKFMTKPGDQWTLRTKVFARIRDLFEREGIKFAHREVTVRIADEDQHPNLTEQDKKAIAAAARSAVEQEQVPGGQPPTQAGPGG